MNSIQSKKSYIAAYTLLKISRQPTRHQTAGESWVVGRGKGKRWKPIAFQQGGDIVLASAAVSSSKGLGNAAKDCWSRARRRKLMLAFPVSNLAAKSCSYNRASCVRQTNGTSSWYYSDTVVRISRTRNMVEPGCHIAALLSQLREDAL
jgi:hypothetical protein